MYAAALNERPSASAADDFRPFVIQHTALQRDGSGRAGRVSKGHAGVGVVAAGLEIFPGALVADRLEAAGEKRAAGESYGAAAAREVTDLDRAGVRLAAALAVDAGAR